MNLHKLIFTKNRCYQAGRKIKPTGIMVHSTGANNPTLRRYVGPDDGLLGPNAYGNHWNRPEADCCVHAFIGKLADGSIATYQVLPWDHRAWHCGGAANNSHISFEICEDGLDNRDYFEAVYAEAVELCVHLCKLYALTEQDIICHAEGSRLGIASNHGDVEHWFPRHGKSMGTFRRDVGRLLHGALFADVPADAWYAEAVRWAVDNGITAGVDQVHFGPDLACTRAQAITMVWAMQGKPSPEGSYNPFTDVPHGCWFEAPVIWALETGVAAGIGPREFGSDQVCTRAQIATMLYSLAGSPRQELPEFHFGWGGPGDYFFQSMLWASRVGVVAGTGDGDLAPRMPCTRAMIVQMLYKYSQL